MAQTDAAGSFGEGFANALGSDIQARTKQKLELAMLSKRLELENAARLQAISAEGEEQRKNIQAQSQANGIPVSALGSLASGMGMPVDTSGLPSTVPGAFAGAALGALGEAAQRRLLLSTKMTQNQPIYDRTTGIQKGERPTTLFGPGSAKYDASVNPAIQQAQDIIAQRDGLLILKNVLSGQPTGPISGNIAAALARAGVDPQAAQTQAGRQALLTAMPKVLAGFNRFNEPEIARLDATLPSLSNTPAVNQKVFDSAFATLQSRVESLGMGQDDVDSGKNNRFDMKQFISPQGRQLFYNDQPQQPSGPVGASPVAGNAPAAPNPYMNYSFGDLANAMGQQHANHSKILLKNAKLQDQANGQ